MDRQQVDVFKDLAWRQKAELIVLGYWVKLKRAYCAGWWWMSILASGALGARVLQTKTWTLADAGWPTLGLVEAIMEWGMFVVMGLFIVLAGYLLELARQKRGVGRGVFMAWIAASALWSGWYHARLQPPLADVLRTEAAAFGAYRDAVEKGGRDWEAAIGGLEALCERALVAADDCSVPIKFRADVALKGSGLKEAKRSWDRGIEILRRSFWESHWLSAWFWWFTLLIGFAGAVFIARSVRIAAYSIAASAWGFGVRISKAAHVLVMKALGLGVRFPKSAMLRFERAGSYGADLSKAGLGFLKKALARRGGSSGFVEWRGAGGRSLAEASRLWSKIKSASACVLRVAKSASACVLRVAESAKRAAVSGVVAGAMAEREVLARMESEELGKVAAPGVESENGARRL